MTEVAPHERIVRAQEQLLLARERESRRRGLELRGYLILSIALWAGLALYVLALGEPAQRWASSIAVVCVVALAVGLVYELRGGRETAAIYSQAAPILPVVLYAWIFSVEAGFGSYLFIGALGVPVLVPENRQRTRVVLVGLLIAATVLIQVVFTRTGAVEPLPIHETTQLATFNRVVMSIALFALALMLNRSVRVGRRLDLDALALSEAAANTDALTGLPNRRRVWAVVGDLAAANTRFSLSLVDIDHFKNFNDTYGHDVGDATLVHVAGVLAASTRADDVVGRWGGEEFVVILPGPVEDARAAMDRVREVIAADPVVDVGQRVTVSAGVARHEVGEDPWHTLRRADRALYEAKRAGRDRVMLDAELVP